MTPWTYLLAVLAVLGGSIALSVDEIAEPLRTWLQRKGWRWQDDGDLMLTPDGGQWIDRPKAGAWRWLWKLADCPYCTGTWMSLAATFVVAGADLFTWQWWLAFWSIRGGHLLATALFLRLR